VASLSKKELLAMIEKQSAQLKKYEAIIDKQDRRIAELETENVLLRQKVDLLVRRLFGPSSEKLDALSPGADVLDGAPGVVASTKPGPLDGT
jgi:hypothetical protein